jgi:hypothetical protein
VTGVTVPGAARQVARGREAVEGEADVVYYLSKALGLRLKEEYGLLDVWVADLLYRSLKVYYDLRRGED